MSDRDDETRPPYGAVLPPKSVPSSDFTTASLVHAAGGLLAFIGLWHNFWVLAALVPSLALLLASRSSPWRRDEARRALNFQITWVAVTLLIQGLGILIGVLLFGAGGSAVGLGFFGLLLLVQTVIAIFDLVISLIAALKARRGGGYRYPVRLDLVK